jgi:hypothetical protein
MPGKWLGVGGSLGIIVSWEHELLVFIVLMLGLNEMVLVLEKKR